MELQENPVTKFKIDKLRPKELKKIIKSPQEIYDLRTKSAQLFDNVMIEYLNSERYKNIVRNESLTEILNRVKKMKFGENLERGIYNFTIYFIRNKGLIAYWNNVQFQKMYLNEIDKTVEEFHLSEFYLLNSVIDLKIKPHEIPFMTVCERNPSLWGSFILSEEKKKANILKVPIETISNLYTCKRCRNNQTTYYQLQTRSADEPMTTFITCVICNNHWKI